MNMYIQKIVNFLRSHGNLGRITCIHNKNHVKWHCHNKTLDIPIIYTDNCTSKVFSAVKPSGVYGILCCKLIIFLHVKYTKLNCSVE